jgi:hypothetical protein
VTSAHGPPNPDYLARDFNSFRTLLLNHLAALAPESARFEVASLESTLVEILAYVADYLSYYQDAVATETYLATARQRLSVRRHARLLDFAPNEGCSARVWVSIEVSAAEVPLPKGTQLLTESPGFKEARLRAGFDTEGYEIFETMHDATLSRAYNRMALAGSGAPVPGSAAARLAGSLPGLKRGDVLVFRDRASGWAKAVRLAGDSQPAVGEAETGIAWHPEDALPAELPADGSWEVLGNIVLADHGGSTSLALPRIAREGIRELVIPCPGLTFAVPYCHEEAIAWPAAEVMRQDPREAEPAIALSEEAAFLAPAALARRPLWSGRRDLVHAGQFESVFAAEPAGEGRVNLRFGDGVHGRRLQPDWDYVARYRRGTGIRGNIGPGTLAHIVSDDGRILGVTNPLHASGGCDPESLEDVRTLAPVAFDSQRRCVTEEDYVAATLSFPGVRAAVAARAWTAKGSKVTIHVCRDGDQPLDEAFEGRLAFWLGSFKLIGDVLSILGADYVVPRIALTIEVESGRAVTALAAAVRDRIMASMTFAFGEPLNPALLVACAEQVPGVTKARVGKRAAAAGAFLPVQVGDTQVIRLDPALIHVDWAQGR